MSKYLYMSHPYYTRKISKKPCYRVKNRTTKRIFSKCTTKEKGKRQEGYLMVFLRNKLGNQRMEAILRERIK
jgi:hypothetical protein